MRHGVPFSNVEAGLLLALIPACRCPWWCLPLTLPLAAALWLPCTAGVYLWLGSESLRAVAARALRYVADRVDR